MTSPQNMTEENNENPILEELLEEWDSQERCKITNLPRWVQ